MASLEGSLAMIDIERGDFLGPAKTPWVVPKNAATALHLSLLDANGRPTPPLAGSCVLGWDKAPAVHAAPTAAPELDMGTNQCSRCSILQYLSVIEALFDDGSYYVVWLVLCEC